jgi:flagella basal body P-ring formation protein FlgA
VLGALGLGLGDLFDQPLGNSFQASPEEWHLRDALGALVVEARIILIAASDIASGRVLSDADVERVAIAAGRIALAYRRLYGRA